MASTFPQGDDYSIRYGVELAAALAKRPVPSRHFVATIGAKTERGGEVVTATANSEISSLQVACVGDMVRYADGSESRITSGAGFAAAFADKPLAIVGSHIENGDTITSSAQSSVEIIRYADEPPPLGFLQVGYIVAALETNK